VNPPDDAPASPPPATTASGRLLAPRQDCSHVSTCAADAAGIGRECPYGPICGTCVAYRVLEVSRGLLLGTCRIRHDRGEFPCTAPICDSYVARDGAVDAKGHAVGAGSGRAQLVRATLRVTGQPAPRGPREVRAASPVLRPKIPDGPLEEFEMTREELKALIREAMDEERGGAAVALSPKWEGGTVLLKPADPALQGKELPIDALLHKVVMVRDKLRVLEQKINANVKLTDAEKVELQAYVTGCYGSLTTFNVLFRDKEEHFVGASTK
jgi:hypothetical protein